MVGIPQSPNDQLWTIVRAIAYERLARDSRVRSEAVSDLAQSTVTALLKRYKRHDHLASLSHGELQALVIRSANNQVLDEHRYKTRKKRNGGVLLSLDMTKEKKPPSEPVADITTVSQLAMRKEVDAQLEQFPATERDIILLWRQDYTVAEIARALGINQTAVKYSLFKAIQRLKRLLYPGVG